MKNELVTHFNNLELPTMVQQWLLDVWDSLQALDDWYDEDEVDSTEKQIAIYKILVSMPSNPFYIDNYQILSPVMATLVLKWCGANNMEEDNEVNAVSFVWRAGYYDLVLMVVNLVHGVEATSGVASYVAKMYGETLDNYLEEFSHA